MRRSFTLTSQPASVAVAALTLAAGSTAIAQTVTVQRLVSAGQVTPLQPAGSTQYAGVGVQPAINNAGLIALDSGTLRPNASFLVQVLLNQALFLIPPSSPVTVSTLAACAEQAPGEPAGIVYAPIIRTGGVSDSGIVSFSALTARVLGEFDLQTFNFTLFARTATGTVRVIGQNDQAPGLPAGVTLAGLGNNIALRTFNRQGASGNVAFFAPLGGTADTSSDQAIFAGPIGALAPVARKGDPVPTLTTTTYSALGEPRLDPDNRVVFRATLTSPVGDEQAIIARAGLSTRVVARFGEPSFDGGVWTAFDQPNTAQGSATLVVARTSLGNDELILDRPGQPRQLLARTGQQAPGLPTGVTIQDLGFGEAPFPTRNVDEPQINAAGTVAFIATLAGPGVGSSNNTALFVGNSTSYTATIRSGNSSPVLPPGTTFNALSSFALNSANQVAIRADLVQGATDLEGLYILQNGALTQIVQTQQPIEFLPGQPKIATDLSLTTGPGRSSGFDAAFSDNGTLVFSVEFADQTDAAYRATIVTPCPANCDGSTTPPVLGPADFSCFLAKFRAGDASANCDGSTTPPVLGPADFSCFLVKFRAGC